MIPPARFIPVLSMLALSSPSAHAQRPPILDMHMHARTAAHYGPPPLPLCAPVERMPTWDQTRPIEDGLMAIGAPCKAPLLSATTDAEVLGQTVALMERYNIVGMLGGQPELVDRWMTAAPGRFIPGLDFRLDRATGTATAVGNGTPYRPMSPDSMRALHARGALKVLGEVLNMYGGIAPDDARMEPYWALAEELDIPVGIHIGPGGPGEVYFGNREYRARLQSALTLEEVLVRHPRLRVYVMHGGYPMLDDLLAVLFAHPQVYVELSMVSNVETRATFHRYLRGIVEAGYGDRVMFGSDQMVWPGLIEAAIESIEEAPFLSARQKRAIFYDNAARFLRLGPDDMARHRGARPRPRAAPLVTRVEHFFASAPDSERLFRIFRDTLGLAEVWPYQSWGGFASGGVSLGNVVFELVRWKPPAGETLRSAFAGIAFEPPGTTDALIAELRRRGIPHTRPDSNAMRNAQSVNVGWVNTGLPQLDAWNVFVCDYLARRLVADGRLRASDALARAQGGVLGVRTVNEIVLGAKDMDAALARWRKLIDDPAQESNGVFTFGAGPRIRLARAATDGITGIVIQVHSLTRAKSALAGLRMLGPASDGRVLIAPSTIGGLEIALVP
jgi:uncharacterized protein